MTTATGSAGQARPRGANLRWMMVFLAFLGLSINYIDRSNLSVAVPYLDKDLGLSDTATGIILGAFFYTYAVFQLPMGYWVDRFGSRFVFSVAVVWWSIFTAATALARGFFSLFGFRLLLGVGEAGGYPSSAKVVSQWFPQHERALATSIYDAGARVGTAFSLPIVTVVIAIFGWRASFVVTGILGLIWVVFWLLFYRSPRQHPRVSQEELQYIETGGARLSEESGSRSSQRRSSGGVQWRDLFRYRTIWGMMLGFFCLNFVIYFFITWFPDYLVTARHFKLLQLGFFGMIPPLVAVAGGLLGGYASDSLVRRGASLTIARKVCLVGGMAFSSVIALAALVPSAVAALALLSLSYSGLTFAAASVWSLPADVAPEAGAGAANWVGSIGGIQNFASNLAGIASPAVIGFLVDITGTFVTGLVTAGILAIVGALSYLFIVGRVEPLPAERVRGPSRVR